MNSVQEDSSYAKTFYECEDEANRREEGRKNQGNGQNEAEERRERNRSGKKGAGQEGHHDDETEELTLDFRNQAGDGPVDRHPLNHSR